MPKSRSSASPTNFRALPRCETLEDRITPAVTVRFDYTYDTTGYFDFADRRAALDEVANTITANMNDSLAALTPSVRNSWQATTWNSATNSTLNFANLAVGADELVVFITAGNLGGALGVASGGSYSASGAQDWLNTVRTRGQAGVDGGTDYATWGGLIAFNSAANFSFSGSPSSSQFDFKSVASHELMHIFGFGLDNPSYTRHTGTGRFTGSNVVATAGYAVPLQSGEADHFAPGTTYGGHESIMTPAVRAGQVKAFGGLEYAALRDIGWGSASAGTVQVPAAPIAAAPATPTTDGIANARFVVGGGAGGESTITGYGAQGQMTYSSVAFDGFLGGVRVATGDMTGDNLDDLVVAAGPGGGPRIIVIDGATGHQIQSFFAFDAGFRGGVNIALADFDRDGRADIIAGAGFGGGPHVKVFSGRDPSIVLASFLAFDARYIGGVSIAAGDLNGDGTADLAVGAMGGHIATFDGAAIARGNPEALLEQIAAFEAGFGGDISVAVGDLNGDGFGEVIVGAATGSAPRIVAFDGRSLLSRRTVYAASFFAGDANSHAGIRVAALDVDGDGRADIVASPGAGSDGEVRVYTAAFGFGGTPAPAMTVHNSSWAANGTYVG